MRNSIVRIIKILPLFFIAAAFSCSKAKASSEGYIPRIKATAVEERLMAEEVSGFGSLFFLTKVDVNAPQEGMIRRIYYREGMAVPKGARIIDLENPQIELAVGRAENAYSQAAAALKLARSRQLEGEFNAEAEILGIAKSEAEYAQSKKILEEQRRKTEDQEKLYAAGGLSDEAIRESKFNFLNAEEQLRLMEQDLEIRTVGLRDEDLKRTDLYPASGFNSEKERRFALVILATLTLRAETEAAEAQLEAAAKELESVHLAKSELTVYSPAAGIVGARYLEEGERVKKDDKIFTLMDTGSLYAIFSLRENDALRLRKGMTARVKVDGTGEVYDGTVDLISPQADSQSFTFSVRVLLAPEVITADEKLKPGMFARITVLLDEEHSVLTVPESAVGNRKDDGGSVFVISQGRVTERNVRFGLLYGDNREICSGLKAGEVVALHSDASLKEGLHVIPD